MTYSQSSKASKSSQTGSTSSGAKTSLAPCGCGGGCGGGCGCGCHEHTPHSEGCCKLTCFERPNYFCGQLLSDADLTLGENYFREKNKLYHRTLDGFGVVCGLRMTCDCECRGRIRIGDGYAIDCCGNDLVVCEPRSFDVIGELRRKKWLMEMPKEPCGDKDEDREYERDCLTRQCFYIGICYSEEPADYVTPYTTDCSAGPGPCQPTRTRECVRFEIYDKLPVRPNPLTEIEKHIECCFRIFREGQFSRGLTALAQPILDILGCDDRNTDNPTGANPESEQPDARRVFAELRALFLHQLRTCPDQYNCNLEHEVCALRPPRPRDESNEGNKWELEAFKALLELIQKYVFSCVLGELTFLCPTPPQNCCVLIGAVEVENGCLTRVINYPRWYLWCFANFFEVLIYTLANEAACSRKDTLQTRSEADEPRKRRNEGCCPAPEVDVCQFMKLFLADSRAAEAAAASSVHAIQAMHRSLVAGFDFMKPHGIAPAVFNNMPFTQGRELANYFNFPLLPLGDAPSESQDPISALLANLIHRGTDPMAAFQATRDQATVATGATRIMDAPALAVGKYNSDALSKMEEKLTRADAVPDLEARIRKLEADLQTMKEASHPAPPQNSGGDTK